MNLLLTAHIMNVRNAKSKMHLNAFYKNRTVLHYVANCT